LFKKAKQIFKEVNYSLDNSLRYDEKLFWERYTNRFTELLSINPQIGMKFYENNIRIKGEKVTGPEKMAYLFDELRDVFSSSEATEYLSKIIARIPQKKLSNNAVIDILRIAQGCLLFRKRRILKDIAEKETYITSNEVIEKAGRQLLGDVIKKLGIDIEIDAKTVNNWIKYNNPWSSIIAFTTFYKRCKKNNLKIELGIIRETAENILKGTYKEYRYDTEQLDILSEEQKEIWIKNDVAVVEEREVSVQAKEKAEQIKEKIRDMVEHGHIKDEFIRNKLAEMLHNPIVNIEKLNIIIWKVNRKTKAGPVLIGNIAKIQYFENVQDMESVREVLDRLHIIKTILALYNLSVEEIDLGQIEVKVGKKSIVKITNGAIKSLEGIEEDAAAADMRDMLDNIIQPTKLMAKGKITVEDTDDPFILASIGEKPVVTCQGYNYPRIDFFRCLPAYLSDSNKKVMIVRRNGVPIARAIIRIMKGKEGKPVIFLEKIYTSTGEKFKKNILEHILEKAEKMGIRVATKLEVGGIDAVLTTISCLESTGTRNEYEYSDAVLGKRKGIWGIEGRVNVLTPIVKEGSKDGGRGKEPVADSQRPIAKNAIRNMLDARRVTDGGNIEIESLSLIDDLAGRNRESREIPFKLPVDLLIVLLLEITNLRRINLGFLGLLFKGIGKSVDSAKELTLSLNVIDKKDDYVDSFKEWLAMLETSP
ncbi:MAG: hypothetical protein KAJ79_06070, partial [Candidatus Omnitrophica bacterium]|nr:hypothetical protein [Candidatus Omnitrophota bacterium]